MIEEIRLHWSYTTWATRRLLDAASRLSPPELNRDFKTADHSVLGTLVHVMAADRIWYKRVKGLPYDTFIEPDDHAMETLISRWSDALENWKSLLDAETEESLGRTISYRSLKGDPYESPLWQIVLHVVNHATHHRGQVAGFLRVMGYVPPPLDLIDYYRSLAA